MMKTKLLKSIIGVALFAIPFMNHAQQYTINSPIEDSTVSHVDSLVVNFNPYLWNAIKIGRSAVGTGAGVATTGIIPFQLPARPAGKSVVGAKLSVYVSYGREGALFPIDLSGLTYQQQTANGGTGRLTFVEDHYAGAFGDNQNGRGAVGIEQTYFEKNVAGWTLDTPRWEDTSPNNANLIAYINAQYDAGAIAGDWVFLRLTIGTWDLYPSHYFEVTGGDSATPPTLILDFDTALSVENIERQALGLYPNPVTDGRLRVSLEGFSNEARLDIYSITGQLVHSEKIESGSRNSFETQLNLKSGLYIVKLQDGERGATQKLIVQ